MTNEEAIKFGKLIIEIAGQCDDKESEHTIEFTKLAVESLENQKFIIAELEKIKDEIYELKDFNEACCGGSDLGKAIKVIKDHIAELKGE